MSRDPHIACRDAAAARSFQLIYPAMQRLLYRSPAVEFATKAIAAPATISVPTRHGSIDMLVFSPSDADIAEQASRGEVPPVHFLTHGGAFILQYPIEEGNVARYLASEVGAFVVIPDYTAAPQVRFPVAEEQLFDAFAWVRDHADEQGWDANRVSVGGPSAGGQYALSLTLMAIDAGGYVPVAVSSEYGVADLSRSDDTRTSPKRNPVVGRQLMSLVRNTYFKDVDLLNPLASPARHPRLAELPPALILTAEFDTLRHESNDLATALAGLGVNVTHHEFAGVDHGFTHTKPAEVAKAAITMLGDHLAKAYRNALPTAG